MWVKEKDKKVDFDRHIGHTTLISANTEIKGDILFSGGLQVDGRIVGNVTAEEGSEALIRVSESGCIEGEIRSPNVVINGKIKGDVYSSAHVELAAKAIVTGHVYYSLIEMVMGAEVNGSLMHQKQPVSLEAHKAAKVQAVSTAEGAPNPARSEATITKTPAGNANQPGSDVKGANGSHGGDKASYRNR